MQRSRIIKASLNRLFMKHDSVFIVAHKNLDMDALGASMGMALICKKKSKKYYIIIDDDDERIEPVTKNVLMELLPRFNIIRASDAERLITDKSMMIIVDVNKSDRILLNSYLDRFGDILIIDHHNLSEDKINAKYAFIDPSLSSTCEEVSRLLSLYKIKLSKDEANYLLAGISLDTNNYTSPNVSADTFDTITNLVRKGAKTSDVKNMFAKDYIEDRTVQKLVSNTEFYETVVNGEKIKYSISSERYDKEKVYRIEQIAKAADYSLEYKVTATFAMAYIAKNVIFISARSKNIIDVSKIMKSFNGGGREHCAAATIEGLTLNDIKNRIVQLLAPEIINTTNIVSPSKNQKLFLTK